jgi:hypothetical protein
VKSAAISKEPAPAAAGFGVECHVPLNIVRYIVSSHTVHYHDVQGKAGMKAKGKGGDNKEKEAGVPMAGAAAAAGGSDAVASSGLRISASTQAAQEAIEKQLAAAAEKGGGWE